MLDTSRDVLNITLSVSVGILTALLGLLLIYCIRVIKTIAGVGRRIDATLRLAEDAVAALRDRARDLASMLPLVMKAADKLITYVGERKQGKKQKTQIEQNQ